MSEKRFDTEDDLRMYAASGLACKPSTLFDHSDRIAECLRGAVAEIDRLRSSVPPAVTIVRDGVNEDVAVVINDRKVVDCKNYETDHWVSAIVEALGGTYEEVVDVERLEGLLGAENG